MPSSRRTGTPDARTRTLLLDAAERLLLDEGYAAVTSRRVGKEAGITPQLVHYYFRSMDDLFVEVLRRRVEEGFERFARVLAEDCSLQSLWRLSTGPPGARFNLEFAALANHREAIRDEFVRYAERFRQMQLEAITSLLAEHGVSPDVCPPVVALMAMMGVAQIMDIETALGIGAGHEETVAFVERFIDDFDRT